MATYKELRDESGNTELQHRIQMAIVIAANTILTRADMSDPPYSQAAGAHELRAKWAAAAVRNTEAQARDMFRVVLAANASATVAQIRAATDEAIQSNVDAVVDALATAQYGV